MEKYTFFPDSVEAERLSQMNFWGFARAIKIQPLFTAQFLHWIQNKCNEPMKISVLSVAESGVMYFCPGLVDLSLHNVTQVLKEYAPKEVDTFLPFANESLLRVVWKITYNIPLTVNQKNDLNTIVNKFKI